MRSISPTRSLGMREQAARAAGEASEQGASKARVQAQKHQEAVARLTGDNLVLMLKLRQSEAAALSAATQRDSLAAQLEQQKAPWFQQVRCECWRQLCSGTGQGCCVCMHARFWWRCTCRGIKAGGCRRRLQLL